MLSALFALLAPVALGQIASNCTQYCTTIQTVCTGPNSQFSGPGIDASLEPLFCGAVCAVYNMSGTTGDMSGDTFQCRASHLAVAQSSSDPTNVTLECLAAGFYGGGVCGNNHDGAGPNMLSSAIDFQCDLVRAKCDNMTNMDTCYNNYKDYSLFVMDSFNPNNTKALFHDTGNSLQCRTYNIFETFMGVPTAEACGDGAAISSACAVNCTDFCTLEGSACGWGTSGNNQFATMDACMSACSGWQTAPVNMKQAISMGDTSGCRWYHLSVALTSSTNAGIHCPHTGNWPNKTTGYCVPSCDYYCNTIQTACTGANTVFANNTECMTACGNYTWLNAPYTRPVTKGNNLQCRTYHAEVAFVSASNAAIHCPHASPMSTPDWCGASAASSVKVGVATAFLLLVGVASSFLGF